MEETAAEACKRIARRRAEIGDDSDSGKRIGAACGAISDGGGNGGEGNNRRRLAHEWVAACKRIAAEFGGTGAVQRLVALATKGTVAASTVRKGKEGGVRRRLGKGKGDRDGLVCCLINRRVNS